MTQIINFHHYDRDAAKLTAEFGDDWLYIGRENNKLGLKRSPLANPFTNRPGLNASFSTNPIGDYRSWLWGRIQARDTAVIEALEKIGPNTALVCWCAPKPCHAEVVAAAAAWWQEQQTLLSAPETLPEQALSVRQPWAWLIVRPDIVDDAVRLEAYRNGRIKNIENRDWRTSFRGWFLVHAAKTFDEVGYRYAVAHYPDIDFPAPSEYQKGGVVGAANLVDVVESSPNRWFVGKYGFVLQGARSLPFTPCPGRLNFFKVQEEIIHDLQGC